MDIFPKKTFKCPTGNEKAFNITHHQENANQNHTRYPLIPVRMGIIKKIRGKC